jgi:nitroimidazol reductase NimA-like FMN-containing flavoprotein (pyridoxamine 5'-phosphate oxidase superfamily)
VGPLSKEAREAFLAEPHIGVVSVASDDGRPPLAVPIWYAYEPGGNLTFFSGTQGRRARKIDLIRKAGAISFVVQHDQFPYRYVTIEGPVIASDKPPTRDQMLKVVRRYLPEEQAQGFVQSELGRAADSELVLFTVRPERWNSFDFGDGG